MHHYKPFVPIRGNRYIARYARHEKRGGDSVSLNVPDDNDSPLSRSSAEGDGMDCFPSFGHVFLLATVVVLSLAIVVLLYRVATVNEIKTFRLEEPSKPPRGVRVLLRQQGSPTPSRGDQVVEDGWHRVEPARYRL